jgi:nucleoside phosphorylase
MKLALFAAFPQELRHIRKNVGSVIKIADSPFPLFLAKQRACEIIAVQTGMSTENIKSAFMHVRDKYRPDVVLSVGFCGALYREARIGDLVWASQCLHFREGVTQLPYSHADMIPIPADAGRKIILETLQGQIRIQEGSFVTLSAWIPKSRLMQGTSRDIPFPVCDRETFHLAELSQQNQLPFFAIRSVTDLADEDIAPQLFQVVDETGHYSILRFLGILIAKPSLLFDSVKLGRNAARASRSLCQAVNALIKILSVPESRSGQRP